MNLNTAKLQSALGSTKNYFLGGNMVPDMNTLQTTGTNSNGQMTFTADMTKNRGKIFNTLAGGFTQDPVTALLTAGSYASAIKSGVDMARSQRQLQQYQRQAELEQRKLAQEQQQLEREKSNMTNEASGLVKIGDDYYKKVDVDDETDEKTKARVEAFRKLAVGAAQAGSKKATKTYRKLSAGEKLKCNSTVDEGAVGTVGTSFAGGFGDYVVGQAIQTAANTGLQTLGQVGANAAYKLADAKAAHDKLKAERELLRARQRYDKEQQRIISKAKANTPVNPATIT